MTHLWDRLTRSLMSSAVERRFFWSGDSERQLKTPGGGSRREEIPEETLHVKSMQDELLGFILKNSFSQELGSLAASSQHSGSRKLVLQRPSVYQVAPRGEQSMVGTRACHSLLAGDTSNWHSVKGLPPAQPTPRFLFALLPAFLVCTGNCRLTLPTPALPLCRTHTENLSSP